MNFPRALQFSREGQEIDHGVFAGIAISVVLIGVAILASGHGLNFVNPSGFLIVLGGTFGATLVHFSMHDLRYAFGEMKEMLFSSTHHPVDQIAMLVTLSQRVKMEGLLILDQEAQQTDDSFLKLGLELTVDGQQGSEVKRILETEMRTSYDRASKAVQVFETMGNYSPAMGLIGTLIGLIKMLGALHDPTTVGPAMSIALVTTFYGALFANVIFLPIAGKLKNRTDEQALVKAITLEGIISLGKQESSIVLEQRLQSFLPAALTGRAY